MNIDDIVCRKSIDFAFAKRLSFICYQARTVFISHIGTTGLSFSLIWLLKKLDVEAEEFTGQEVLDHSIFIQQRLVFKSNPAFQLTVLALGDLPVEFQTPQREANQVKRIIRVTLEAKTVEDLETGVLRGSRLLIDCSSVAYLRLIQLVHRIELPTIFVDRLSLGVTLTRIATFDFHLVLLKVVGDWPV